MTGSGSGQTTHCTILTGVHHTYRSTLPTLAGSVLSPLLEQLAVGITALELIAGPLKMAVANRRYVLICRSSAQSFPCVFVSLRLCVQIKDMVYLNKFLSGRTAAPTPPARALHPWTLQMML